MRHKTLIIERNDEDVWGRRAPNRADTVTYHYRGQIDRVRSKPRPSYTRHAGYSENSAAGNVLYPWMTAAECREEARIRGCAAVFVHFDDSYRKLPRTK